MTDQSFGAALKALQAGNRGGREFYTRELLRWAFRRKLISGLHATKRRGRPPHRPNSCPRRGVVSESDARWNRIFEEKFADPSYYSSPPQTRMLQSPLARILK